MSPSGVVSNRCVNPLPEPVVVVCTVLAPTNKSVAIVVFTVPLLLNGAVAGRPYEYVHRIDSDRSRNIPRFGRPGK